MPRHVINPEPMIYSNLDYYSSLNYAQGYHSTFDLVVFLHIIQLTPLRWRHNGRNGVSNHQPHDCLLNRLFRRRSKKTSKLRFTGLCASPHKGPVTRKMFPIDDVITSVIWICPTDQKWFYQKPWLFFNDLQSMIPHTFALIGYYKNGRLDLVLIRNYQNG